MRTSQAAGEEESPPPDSPAQEEEESPAASGEARAPPGSAGSGGARTSTRSNTGPFFKKRKEGNIAYIFYYYLIGKLSVFTCSAHCTTQHLLPPFGDRQEAANTLTQSVATLRRKMRRRTRATRRPRSGSPSDEGYEGEEEGSVHTWPRQTSPLALLGIMCKIFSYLWYSSFLKMKTEKPMNTHLNR